MKRFHVFACHQYEPRGGMQDHIGGEDTFEAAKALADKTITGSGGYLAYAEVYDFEPEEPAEVYMITRSKA